MNGNLQFFAFSKSHILDWILNNQNYRLPWILMDCPILVHYSNRDSLIVGTYLNKGNWNGHWFKGNFLTYLYFS